MTRVRTDFLISQIHLKLIRHGIFKHDMIFMVKELQVELEYKKVSCKFLVPLAHYVKAKNMCKIFSLIPSKKLVTREK